MKSIYWDYNATAPVRAAVRERVMQVLESRPGNPSSMHCLGQDARAYLETVRRKAASALGLQPSELIFTSSATESNFLALWGYWFKHRQATQGQGTRKILASGLEHPSVRKNIEFLAEVEGIELSEIPLKKTGEVDLEALEKKLAQEDFWLCSLYAACNESGVIYPWQEIARLCRKNKTPFHCDMVQLLGRQSFDLSDKESRPHSCTFAFHKSGGLKATGILAVSTDSPWMPILRGGGQEKKRRAGTENMLGVASIDAFFEEAPQIVSEYQTRVREVRDTFEKELKSRIPQVKIVGEALNRLPNTSYVVFPGIASDEMLMNLDIKNICASAGSACSSALSVASVPLLSMGFSEQDSRCAVRFSLGESSSLDQIPLVLEAIEALVKKKARIHFEASHALDSIGA